MVHQHFMLVPSLTVAENMVLGMVPKKGLFIDHAKAVEITKEYAERFNLHVEPEAKVVDIPVGMKQKDEILKALVRGAKILILDDSVSAVDTKTERTILDNLKKREGLTTILIAHRISTVEQMDKIVFVEDGEVHAVGKHEDLYRTCTAYRKMVDLQKLEEEAGEE